MKFEVVTPDRFEDVIFHLKTAFFADEPLNKAVKLCRAGEGHEELERLSVATLQDNLSLMALNENRVVVGVAINGILKRGDLEKAQQALATRSDEKFKKIFQFLYDENLRSNIFDALDVDQFFEIRILSVDSACRGQGIAKKLLEESERLARRSGFLIMKADATGLFSQKITGSLGFRPLSETRYDSYLGSDGAPVFDVDSPHEALKIMYKFIE